MSARTVLIILTIFGVVPPVTIAKNKKKQVLRLRSQG